MAPVIKLYYFDFAGRAEPIRWALQHAKLTFEDIRFPREEWPKYKALSPNGMCPFMEVDGVKYCESHACFLYAASQANLMPADPQMLLKCHMLTCLVESALDKAFAFMHMSEKCTAECKEAAKTQGKETALKLLAAIEDYVTKFSADGLHSVGQSLTYADLVVSNGYDCFEKALAVENMASKFPALFKIQQNWTTVRTAKP